MKFLKKTLADNKDYTFSTFTIKEQRYFSKEYRKFQKMQEDLEKLQLETDEDEKLKKDELGNVIPKESISEEDQQKIEEIENQSIDFMIDVIRSSLCRNHQEFKRKQDPVEDRKIIEDIMGLVDLPDLRKITEFAFSGTFIADEDNYDVTITKTSEENGK